MQLKNKFILTLFIIIFIITFKSITFAISDRAMNSSSSTTNQNIQTTSSSMKLEIPIVKQNKEIDLQQIIEKNEKDVITEKIEKNEIDVEFSTHYRENNSLAKGKIQTLQEGQDGKQNAIVKSIYKEGELIKNEQLSSEVTKASIDKIVEVGIAAYGDNYVPIVGDKLEATPYILAIRTEPSAEAEKVITINKGNVVTLVSQKDDWYYVQYETSYGWAEKNSLTHYDPNQGGSGDGNTVQYSKEELTQNLGFSMLLNRKSGLTVDQFKKIFSNDTNDKKNVFKENAEYFYYVEQQYNINGLFVASVAIHESAWGTSNIAQSKRNLFGYQAYDNDPYNSAQGFSTYAEGIDLVSRVFVKYYINPPGTAIYNGEKAVGTYYKGSTVSAVNTSYATDKNWANCVYKWIVYLYNKL